MKIGETFTADFQVKICASCLRLIAMELCSFQCTFDCATEEERKGNILLRTIHRVDTLVKEEVV